MACTANEHRPGMIIVVGPTASGKTHFAIDLARRFDGEIIGADSMQIYQHMDIGTAKPTPAEQAAATHHMIDVVAPDVDFDAAMYGRLASACVDEIISRGRRPIVAGGTGFYIKALMYGLFDEGPADPDIRKNLKARAEAEGSVSLHEQLFRIDPESAKKIHPHDTYRIIRAMEIYAVTGKAPSAVQKCHGFQAPRFRAITIGLSWPRSVLYDRINQRVDRMMDEGLMDEVEGLLNRGYGRNLKSMQSLGYRHLAAVVAGEASLGETLQTLKRDHRHYAKRQMTWFGADPAVHWIDPDQGAVQVDEKIHAFLASL
ncbi:tRNA (adenosine(37)-N6)-dimethylallyltransferase MiaA [Desulfosarcina sp. OttesenSCG-928-A07]|nr:tRNA (adenosine(37)-N6)-dimethylallyltransferase MiaA [Desulfosarcina sp. OttesenSCG-928-A07]